MNEVASEVHPWMKKTRPGKGREQWWRRCQSGLFTEVVREVMEAVSHAESCRNGMPGTGTRRCEGPEVGMG